MDVQFNTPSSAASGSKKLPFSSSERELIVALVRERPIIEDKRINAKNIVLKKQAWEELAVAFNAQPYVSYRNSVQLKRCWENMKTMRKKELSQESCNMKGTGGGPAQGGSAIEDNVVDVICPFINLTVPNVIDSNSIEISQVPQQKIAADAPLLPLEPYQMQVFRKRLIERMLGEDDEMPGLFLKTEIENKNKLKRKLTETLNSNNNLEDIAVTVDGIEDNIVYSQPPKKTVMLNTSTGTKGLLKETDARIKRCKLNIEQDKALHEMRLQREKILLQKEQNQLLYEEEMHKLQIEKIKLEIDILKKK